jgi:beta-glucuronidase
MSALRRLLIITAAMMFASASGAAAQPPQPPTKGALYTDGQTGRYLLGGSWLFRADPGDVGLAQRWWLAGPSTAGWTAVTVPNTYNAGDYSNAGTAGSVGWYRRDFTLPPAAFASYVPRPARHWIIRFELVNYYATVWLDGRLVGSHSGGLLPFELDLGRVRPGVNQLIVRVDNRRNASQPPPGPGAGWWNFGGILREVYLRAVQRADISQVQVRPVLPCPRCPATLEEQAIVRNVTGSPQRVGLRGRYGNQALDFGAATIPAHGTWTAIASTVVYRPRLWSIDRPALYRATLSLSDRSGRRLQSYVVLSGIRSIQVTAAGGLKLNGRLLNLRGVELREQDVQLGAALDQPHLRRLVSWVRTLGATLIRSEPLSPQIVEAADRDGILIWSDVAINQQVTDVNLADPAWLSYARTLLQTNILDYQNHPSVLLWSVGNELPTPATPAETSYLAGVSTLLHRLDPTRPVGMSISDWPGLPCQSAYGPLDVLGFNEYFGWFDAGGGATDDRVALSPFLDSFRACYPQKALLVSEFGVDGNRNGPIEERGTYQFQADAAAYHLGVYATKPWLAGAIYFLLQDAAAFPNYQGGNPWPQPPFLQKGLIDVNGNPKPAFAVVQSIFHATRQIAPARGG